VKNSSLCPVNFPVVAVVGPTAVGKTSVAIRLARSIGAHIINLDSIQVYKGLDIGSAKPSLRQQAMATHHLLDIREPYEPLDAASFARIATNTANRLLSDGKNVVFAGGTGFYLDAVLKGLSSMPGRLPGLREFLRNQASRSGTGPLYAFLRKIDPVASNRIHPNDLYRVIRGIEVFLSSGRPLSWWYSKKTDLKADFSRQRVCVKVGLCLPRPMLYEVIDQRVDEMMASGLVEEVKALLQKGLDYRLKPLQSLGYRHIIRYLQGSCSLEVAISEMKRDTRRYAKRQLTWFRKDPQIKWFRPDYLMSCHDIWKAVN